VDVVRRIHLVRRGEPARLLYEHREPASVDGVSRDEALIVISHSEHGDSRHPALRVIDPKGEYEGLATGCGVVPIRLAPGGSVRLNPLEVPGGAIGADRSDDQRRQAELLSSLLAASLGRPLHPRERTCTELALSAVHRSTAPPTLPAVVHSLLVPDAAEAARVHTDAATLAEDGREVALELRRLVEGDLRGVRGRRRDPFDGDHGGDEHVVRLRLPGAAVCRTGRRAPVVLAQPTREFDHDRATL